VQVASNLEKLAFYFDPLCPWAWRTASWIHEVRRQIPLDVHWRFFSLTTHNGRATPDLDIPLRTLALVREQAGNEGVERVYLTLGTLIHGNGRDTRNRHGMEAAVGEALDRAGLSRNLLGSALADASTERKVSDETREAQTQYGAYGVPWLVVGDRGFGFQGPVVDPPPAGDAAVDLWRHVSWLLAEPCFFELKRSRR
jgi:2-hydroxychromene-2-carboxylate isomerase